MVAANQRITAYNSLHKQRRPEIRGIRFCGLVMAYIAAMGSSVNDFSLVITPTDISPG